LAGPVLLSGLMMVATFACGTPKVFSLTYCTWYATNGSGMPSPVIVTGPGMEY